MITGSIWWLGFSDDPFGGWVLFGVVVTVPWGFGFGFCLGVW